MLCCSITVIDFPACIIGDHHELTAENLASTFWHCLHSIRSRVYMKLLYETASRHYFFDTSVLFCSQEDLELFLEHTWGRFVGFHVNYDRVVGWSTTADTRASKGLKPALKSVRLFVCPSILSFAWCMPLWWVCCWVPCWQEIQRRSQGAQQQQQIALSRKCEQCHVFSWRRKLNTDLFKNVLEIDTFVNARRHLQTTPPLLNPFNSYRGKCPYFVDTWILFITLWWKETSMPKTKAWLSKRFDSIGSHG